MKNDNAPAGHLKPGTRKETPARTTQQFQSIWQAAQRNKVALSPGKQDQVDTARNTSDISRHTPTSVKEGKALTPKQRTFVDEYLLDLNATQAAIRAGYSEATARSQGQRLLTKVDVARAIAEATKDRADRTETDVDWVLREAKEAYLVCKKDGDLKTGRGYLELIGKHNLVGAFAERHVNGSDADTPMLSKVEIVFVNPGEVRQLRPGDLASTKPMPFQ